MDLNIILIHIGDEFFEHINTHLEQLRKFNNCDIFLGISKKHHQHIRVTDVTLVDIDDIEKTETHKQFEKIANSGNYWSINNFWKSATERFFYIESIAQKFKLNNIYHFEYDNMIYVNLEELLPIFENNYYIAATFDNDNRCIPGFMYFKDADDLEELNRYMLSSRDKNDMEILASFRNSGLFAISSLPILPNTYTGEFKTKTGLTTRHPHTYTNNFDKFNSIFDAAAIGQYLGGISPRNTAKPEETIGFVNESCIFDVSNFEYVWLTDEANRNIPYMEYKNKLYRINNLHIHSKQLEKFLS